MGASDSHSDSHSTHKNVWLGGHLADQEGGCCSSSDELIKNQTCSPNVKR
ncbi:hypothetical protein MPTK1_7g06940 [Marchantia polymorpha subsp. ruderalis]|uniref:Uncharacterized protein n=2 Tax=Marchantia polymorpha TaxID=3197 RepID=A0AAF6BWX4_MARPO|nr:hypothetical protein MARPO_0076s0100 [Marchantia polymorpha]BBN16508.1 hypothetical protein Mp_7g06940 [Marchantia polymorpha subsp. ruderalis]|eukprot:PTQ34870.1 hypothetical protein MARPO_0076s0100 [Marchantia polymorpha]